MDCLQKDNNFLGAKQLQAGIDESGNKKYFKDDKFGLAILTKIRM